MTDTETTPERMHAGCDAWLLAFATLVRTAMVGRYDIRACVAGCRIGLDVLSYFRVKAEPYPVQVAVFSSKAVEWHTAHGWEGTSPVGHSVGIGFSTPEGAATRMASGSGDGTGDWDGHLVLRLPGRDALVDITIDQAHRPMLDLWMPSPLVLPVADAWPERPSSRLSYSRGDNGTVITYGPLPEGPGRDEWRQGNNWRQSTETRRTVAGQAIRALREITR